MPARGGYGSLAIVRLHYQTAKLQHTGTAGVIRAPDTQSASYS